LYSKYKEPTKKGFVTPKESSHPYGHKLFAINYLIIRVKVQYAKKPKIRKRNISKDHMLSYLRNRPWRPIGL
jgi:hypothetical protein